MDSYNTYPQQPPQPPKQPPQPKMTKCPKCHRMVLKGEQYCPYCGAELKRFYEKLWFTILLLICIPPLGIFFLWYYQRKRLNKIVLIVLTVIFGAYTFSWFPATMEDYKQSQIAEEQDKTLDSIEATYNGPTKAGTVVDVNSDFTVQAVYESGRKETITEWKVTSPAQTLEAGSGVTVTVEYKNKSTEVSIPCSSINKEDYKSRCVPLDYELMLRDKSASAVKSYTTGRVQQVLEDGNEVVLIVATEPDSYSGYSGKNVWIRYEYEDDELHVLEDDIITFYGLLNGTQTYTTVLGAEETIPYVHARVIERN